MIDSLVKVFEAELLMSSIHHGEFVLISPTHQTHFCHLLSPSRHKRRETLRFLLKVLLIFTASDVSDHIEQVIAIKYGDHWLG